MKIERVKLLEKTKKVVIKIGSSLLTSKEGKFTTKYIKKIIPQIVSLHKKGLEIVIVSSGAISCGMNKLTFSQRPKNIPIKQAIASIGQIQLMRIYQALFNKYKLTIGQILVTQPDFSNRISYLNIRNTLSTLLKLKIIPIINENDSVAVEEIKFGDNDILSALITNLAQAELLIILSNIDGFYTDPQKKQGLVKTVEKITKEMEKKAYKTEGITTIGGMLTKLQAAKIVTNSGELAIIANGIIPNILFKIFSGEEIGSFFLPQVKKISSKKRWIAFNLQVKGKIIIDQGAINAIKLKGKSLLPSGIKEIKGNFKAGELVEILDNKENFIARGLVNYDSSEIKKIKGYKTKDIKKILGYNYDEVIHRNNLVVF